MMKAHYAKDAKNTFTIIEWLTALLLSSTVGADTYMKVVYSIFHFYFWSLLESGSPRYVPDAVQEERNLCSRLAAPRPAPMS